jgi:hypothetical protein
VNKNASVHVPQIFAYVAHMPIGTVNAHAGVDDSSFTCEHHSPREVRAIEEIRTSPTTKSIKLPHKSIYRVVGVNVPRDCARPFSGLAPSTTFRPQIQERSQVCGVLFISVEASQESRTYGWIHGAC